MSVYKTVQSEVTDPVLLCQVLDELKEETGLEYVYDANATLDFYKWHARIPRGTGAVVVIGRQRGGLDTTPRRFCGDTALVPNGDGTYRWEADTAHGNAAKNMEKIQNLYALRNMQRNLPRGIVIKELIRQADGSYRVVLGDPRQGRANRGERQQPQRRQERVRS